MRRRFEYKHRELEDFLIRFYPAGNYTWVVPGGCTEVDVFLVGGGGGKEEGPNEDCLKPSLVGLLMLISMVLLTSLENQKKNPLM